VNRLQQTIDEDGIQKRGQRATLGNSAVYCERLGEATLKADPCKAALVECVDQAPQFPLHTFVSKAIKESMMHHTIISFAPVQEQ
jgi:hypothetical protein